MAFNESFGDPFTGRDQERVRIFLKEQELDYDSGIEHTVILQDRNAIIATASCQGNVIKCVAVSPDCQGQNLMGQLIAHMIGYFFDHGITHYFVFTKPKNKDIFCSLGFYPVAETDRILLMENKKNGLKKYIAKLGKETREAMESKEENTSGEGIGAIVANCNPFTLGHRYLMETAARECRVLHIFILSAEQDFITSGERLDLVKAGTKDLENIIIHRTSDYLISPAVFPTYFIKDKTNAYEMNCMLDIKLFTEAIAPALGITKRFVGTEPNCRVTNAYNRCLQRELPRHGIELKEITRKEENGQVISASYVRAAYRDKDLERIKGMVPETTYQFLEEKRNRNVTVYQMIDARDRRVAAQTELLAEYKCPVVSFTLNIPGPVKTSEEYLWLFEKGKADILEAIHSEGWTIHTTQYEYKVTGYECRISVDCDPITLKKKLTELEERTPAGRLYDIDVIRLNGTKVSREEIGRGMRRCIICREAAHVCGRNRSHTIQEMTDRISRIIEDAKNENECQ